VRRGGGDAVIASKLPKVGTTIFTEMSALAAKHQAVNLGQGFPDFDGPEFLRESLSKHMAAGRNQYAPMTGVAPLREAIAAKTLALYGATVDPVTDITVTSGATEALFAAIAAVVHPGEQVIVLDPCYDSYEPAIELQGASAIRIPLNPTDFSLPLEAIADALKSRPRLLLINSPHNPTGAVISRAELDALAELLRDTDTLLLSDEVYEHIIFDGREHASVLAHPELRERAFVISSFGKTYHATGWKIGYCVAPPALSAEFRKVHQYLTFASFTPAQYALADMLVEHPEHHLELPKFYQHKRDYFSVLLEQTPFKFSPAQGAYFQVADYSALSDEPDHVFARYLTAEIGVAVIPISAFYGAPDPKQRLVRFCFAKRETTLDQAAERLGRLRLAA
jgi:methionine transaminase